MAYLPGQQYVQNASGVWTPVGYAAGNAVMPINISSSSGNVATTSGTISVAVGNTPGTAVTASTTAQIIATVGAAGNATFHLVTSAFVGTLVFEASMDNGLNYAPIMAAREDGTGSETSTAISTAAAFIRAYTAGIPGFTHFRIRCSVFTSGTIAVLVAQGAFLIETNPSLAASTAVIGTVLQGLAPTGTTGVANGNIGVPFYATGAAAFAAASVISSPGVGLSLYVTDMEGSNEGAAGTAIAFSEGAAAPVRYRRFMAASGGGFATNLKTPWKLPANTALWAVVPVTTTWNYTINYYIAP